VSVLTKKTALAAGAALVLAAGAAWWFFLRGPRMAEIARFLPAGDGPTLGIDVGTLRTLRLVKPSQSGAAIDPDYRRFIEATGFDYTRDLDKVVLTWRRGELSIIASGRFDRARLESYAKSSGGRCLRDLCTMQGSGPERQIGFAHLRPGILGIVVGPDQLGAASLGAKNEPAFRVPLSPVWVTAAAGSPLPLQNVPPGVRALLGALEGSSRATLSVTAGASGAVLELEADCPDASRAKEVAERLQRGTEQFLSLMKRENLQVDPNGLSGLLATGRFHAESARAIGRWPVPKAMVEAISR
jgi:hypothetical protein